MRVCVCVCVCNLLEACLAAGSGGTLLATNKVTVIGYYYL